MRLRLALAVLATLLFAAAAAAHAFLGWPPFEADLREAGLDGSHVGALATGWYFGSVAMATYAALAAFGAWEIRRGSLAGMVPLRLIGASYAGFGVAAWLIRSHNPHFLGFVVIGLTALAAGWPIRR